MENGREKKSKIFVQKTIFSNVDRIFQILHIKKAKNKIPPKKWGSNIIPRNCPRPNQVRSKVTFTSSLTEGP